MSGRSSDWSFRAVSRSLEDFFFFPSLWMLEGWGELCTVTLLLIFVGCEPSGIKALLWAGSHLQARHRDELGGTVSFSSSIVHVKDIPGGLQTPSPLGKPPHSLGEHTRGLFWSLCPWALGLSHGHIFHGISGARLGRFRMQVCLLLAGIVSAVRREPKRVGEQACVQIVIHAVGFSYSVFPASSHPACRKEEQD